MVVGEGIASSANNTDAMRCDEKFFRMSATRGKQMDRFEDHHITGKLWLFLSNQSVAGLLLSQLSPLSSNDHCFGIQRQALDLDHPWPPHQFTRFREEAASKKLTIRFRVATEFYF